MENLIQPCSHSEAAFIALSNRLPIMVVIEKSSILIPGILILISHLIFCNFALFSFSAIRAETIWEPESTAFVRERSSEIL